MATAQLTAPQIGIALASDDLVTREIEGNETNGDVSEKQITPDEFIKLKVKHAELVDGEVIEKMPPVFDHDEFAFIIAGFLRPWVKERGLGRVSGGSFLTEAGRIRAPDVSFLSTEDLEGENTGKYVNKAPTLAVEIVSQNDIYGDVDDKADEFLRSGSKAVWVVNPRHRTVAVHTPDELSMTYRVGDTISGGDILPGFELPVADIFED